VATGGTAYVQTTRITMTAVLVSLALGMLAVAVLVANNLRDIPGDTVSGKRTLAVVLGDRRTRAAYAGCLVIAFLVPVAIAARDGVAALLPWLVLPLAWHALQPVRTGAVGPALIPCLKWTGLVALAYAVTTAVGLTVA
ncbi:MAG: UbiA family prenyltransferase, partial [Williamsia herbipolensis]|nr:UbiA family prenyltransferase [Williamsia herbipolensis]